MKAAVLSAIYDSYDTVKPPLIQQGVDVEWIMVTDDPDLVAPGWRVVVEPYPGVHPNRAAKRAKMFPWLYTEAEQSVWIDASFQVVSRSFVRDVIRMADPIAQFKHPWRNCIYTEIAECVAVKKYAKSGLEAQEAHYRELGHPERWGLWASGVTARHHTPEIRAMSEQWYNDIYEFSYQDQVSLPPALRANGLRPTEFPGTHLANRWLAYQGSSRHSHG